MDRVTAICLCKEFEFRKLSDLFIREHEGFVYRGALTGRYDGHLIVVFDFGCLVTWGHTPQQLEAIKQLVFPYINTPLSQIVVDEFSSETTDLAMIKNDHIRLAGGDDLEKLAFSFGLAQSVKLDEFEQRAEQTISDTYHIPKRIADHGVSGLSRREIAQLRGRLFVAQSDINLKFDLLDTPEFFWEFPELEDRYTMSSNYLDVKRRIDVLNKRLEVIHGILEMLAEEHNHSHSATLEWIIIWLIAFEVVVFFAHDIFKWF